MGIGEAAAKQGNWQKARHCENDLKQAITAPVLALIEVGHSENWQAIGE